MTAALRPVHELRGCQLLRHDVADRFVGDLVGRCCHTCAQVWFTEPVVTVHPDLPISAEREGTPRSSASRADRGVVLATQPA